MIHTASLVHDDVLDECNIRRGEQQHTEQSSTQPDTTSLFLRHHGYACWQVHGSIVQAGSPAMLLAGVPRTCGVATQR